MIEPHDLSKEELLEFIKDEAKLWLAHDGLWFQAVERAHGMESAIDLDRQAWERFTVLEAKRIMNRLNLKEGEGLEALKQALKFRLYAFINEQEIVEETSESFVFRMVDCRVQSARNRKGLPDFPCKPVGLVEYAHFAETIDSRIETACLSCPPDPHPGEYYCAWRFSLKAE